MSPDPQDAAAPSSWWQRLRAAFIAFAEAMDVSPGELQAQRIARLESELAEFKRQLARTQ